MDPLPMVPWLRTAIEGKRRVSFVYHGQLRVAEPQCYGISTADNEALRVHLIKGVTKEREPLFTIAQMQDLRMLDETFTKPGPNYKRGDSAMKYIFWQL